MFICSETYFDFFSSVHCADCCMCSGVECVVIMAGVGVIVIFGVGVYYCDVGIWWSS